MVVIKSPLKSGVWLIVGGDIRNNEKTSNSQTNFINVQKSHGEKQDGTWRLVEIILRYI
jgi:hypothetical protein